MNKQNPVKAKVSDIQRFSTGDGPGIRTTVFLAGCNLRCPWCHNPETVSHTLQLCFYKNLCSGCGLCEKVCPQKAHKINEEHIFHRDKCIACGLCTEHCPLWALKLSYKTYSLKKVLSVILEDKDFYDNSGGGVTLSGGEPLLQPEFCKQIAKLCKNDGMHVIIDTAGNVDYSAFQKVIPYVDTFYYDVKVASEKDYKNLLGGSLYKTLNNLTELIEDGCDVTVRIPLIPGINDSPEYCNRLAELISNTGVKKVTLLAFHRMGTSKYDALGMKYSFGVTQPLKRQKLNELKACFKTKFKFVTTDE